MKKTTETLLVALFNVSLSGLAVGGDQFAANLLHAWAWLGVILSLLLVFTVAPDSSTDLRARLRKTSAERPAWLTFTIRGSCFCMGAALAMLGMTGLAVTYMVCFFLEVGAIQYAVDHVEAKA